VQSNTGRHPIEDRPLPEAFWEAENEYKDHDVYLRASVMRNWHLTSLFLLKTKYLGEGHRGETWWERTFLQRGREQDLSQYCLGPGSCRVSSPDPKRLCPQGFLLEAAAFHKAWFSWEYGLTFLHGSMKRQVG
jgi:hypothetical protein